MSSTLFSEYLVSVHGDLPVGDGHVLYWEQYGSSDGMPLLALHGGLGSASSPRCREQFDPARWCTTQFDQRGCGNSWADDDLYANTTAHLVADIESLRRYLHLENWYVASDSWGATLALAYAAAYPNRVSGIVLRNPFLANRHEIARLFDRWVAPFDWPPHMPLGDRLAAVNAALMGPSAQSVVCAWRTRELALLGKSATDMSGAGSSTVSAAELRRYRVQAHYLAASCFLDMDEVIEGVALARLPVAIIQGECDQLCLLANARRLAQTLPGSHLSWVPGAGHDPYHPAMLQAWQAALAAMGSEWAASKRRQLNEAPA